MHFNPLPPYGGRHYNMPTQRAMEIFQSTPSVWRETPYIWLTRLQLRNFNPLPPYGGRLHNQLQSTATTRFQSTPSVWRETRTQRQRHGERGISIHPLRMEGDIFRNKNRTRTAYFNPLPPYGGGLLPEQEQNANGIFQPTPSLWRETALRRSCTCQR